MLKFAFKNMATKKAQIILIVISIVISASVAVLAFNVSNQVSDGITENAGYYSTIIGPSGSQTQLAMNTMYFAEEPLGTIPYSVVTALEMDSRVKSVVPFAMADNYNGSLVVGTTTVFLEGKSFNGSLFDNLETMQAVVGYNVAKNNGLKIGDVIYTSHSASGGSAHKEGITVVGILNETSSSYDNVVFTQLKTLWHLHEHEGENEEHEEHEGTVCAVLVKAANPGVAYSLTEEYNGKIVTEGDESFILQAIEPMKVVRDILNDADNTKYIVYVLCAIILIMNIIIITIITLLNMYHSSKEISLMRLIGISMKKINLLYILQNSIVGFTSTLIAFGVSRLCLLFMNDYVSSMGVVLNIGKVYPLEIVILVGVFVISVLPTAIWTFVMSKKDSISG